MAISAGMEGGLGILVIGRNYSIKCDDLSFSLPVKLLEEAVGYLVAYHSAASIILKVTSLLSSFSQNTRAYCSHSLSSFCTYIFIDRPIVIGNL